MATSAKGTSSSPPPSSKKSAPTPTPTPAPAPPPNPYLPPNTHPLTLFLPVIADSKITLTTLQENLAKFQDTLGPALASLGIVHYARVAVLNRNNPNLQAEPYKAGDPLVLAVITEYDNDFNAYIQAFVKDVGPFFNGLLQVVVGGAELIPVANHVAGFEALLKKNDASQSATEHQAFFGSYPQTVQDIYAAFPSDIPPTPPSPSPSSGNPPSK